MVGRLSRFSGLSCRSSGSASSRAKEDLPQSEYAAVVSEAFRSDRGSAQARARDRHKMRVRLSVARDDDMPRDDAEVLVLRLCVAVQCTRAQAFRALRETDGSVEAAAGLLLDQPSAADAFEEPQHEAIVSARGLTHERDSEADHEQRVGLSMAVASGVAANLNRLAAASGLREAESLSTHAMALEAATEAKAIADRLSAFLERQRAAPIGA